MSDELARKWPPKRLAGYVKLASIGDTGIFVHWSFPVGGMFVASLGGVDPRRWAYYCCAFTLLVVIHELGHVAAAAALRLKVFSIQVSGLGGLCRIERPRTVPAVAFCYSAGLLAQAAGFLLALAYVAEIGRPTSTVGRAMITTFTLVNGVMFVLNLIPSRDRRSGLATDGLVLSQLFLHVFFGRPHPMPPLMIKSSEESPMFPSGTRLLDIAGFRPKSFNYGIEILNDKTTPMEFVVSMLMKHVGLPEREAILKMIEIHNAGGVLIEIASPRAAANIARAVETEARAAGHALVCRYAGDHEPDTLGTSRAPPPGAGERGTTL